MTYGIKRVKDSTESNCWAILLERSVLSSHLQGFGHSVLGSRQLGSGCYSFVSYYFTPGCVCVEGQAKICVAESRHEAIYCIMMLQKSYKYLRWIFKIFICLSYME